jgi:hypothetical protein
MVERPSGSRACGARLPGRVVGWYAALERGSCAAERRSPKEQRRDQCFSGYRLTKAFRFGMFTFGRVSAFMTSFSPMILLPARMKAVSA